MGIKIVENNEREDASEGTLALMKRWREVTKPEDNRRRVNGSGTIPQEREKPNKRR